MTNKIKRNKQAWKQKIEDKTMAKITTEDTAPADISCFHDNGQEQQQQQQHL